MKVFILAIFIVTCASTTNASSASTRWYPDEYTTTAYTTTKSTTTQLTTPATPATYPSDDYCPIEEIKTCGFKYGVPAAKRQFPYVAFLKSRNAYKVQYCSGSLILQRWVLTSAYCTLPQSIVEVTLGALVPFDEEDPDRVDVLSDDIYIHPRYLPFYRNPKNDVALIKLPKSLKSDAIIPIPLKTDSGPISKDNIIFAAWGEAGYETLTFTKNMAIFKGPCRCENMDEDGEYGNAAMDSELFCCISTDHTFCFIHNGAGLVVNGVLVAVMSTRCFPHCRDHEGIFTNVYHHLQWINNTLIEDCSTDYITDSSTDSSTDSTTESTTELTTDSTTESTTESTTDSSPEVYTTCSDTKTAGVYLIQPNYDIDPFEAYCDIVDGKKWTVIQQRLNKSVDFYRNYATYTKGFGPIDGNHWLGLEKIHQLTKNGDHELRVELQAHNLTRAYAQYSTFKVDSAGSGFKLTISGYSGNAGDSMYDPPGNHDDLNGMKFTTYDKDQDKWSDVNCAVKCKGAWWYKRCTFSNLNSPYYDWTEYGWDTMCWRHNFDRVALKTVRMLIRRK